LAEAKHEEAQFSFSFSFSEIVNRVTTYLLDDGLVLLSSFVSFGV